MSDTPTCREALQGLFDMVTKYESGVVTLTGRWADAERALAAPDRVAALPADVREALQFVIERVTTPWKEWAAKWNTDASKDSFTLLADRCSAILAKYPETAPVPAERDFEKVLDAPDLDAERAAWIRERDELISERDRFEARLKESEFARSNMHGKLTSLTDSEAEASTECEHLRFLAEWLLSQLRGGDS